jgi:hypothetical protein
MNDILSFQSLNSNETNKENDKVILGLKNGTLMMIDRSDKNETRKSIHLSSAQSGLCLF